MAVGYNPKIATEGLTLYYDETNSKSLDTSELVLGRSAVVSSTTERRFNQDSLLQTMYASTAQYNSLAPSPGTGFSFSVWIRRTGLTTGTWNHAIIIDGGGPRYRMLWFGFYSNVTDRIHCSMPYYSAIDTGAYFNVDPTWASAGLTLVENQWYNFCATYDNSTRLLKTFINANFALSGTRPGAGDLNNPNNSQIRIFGCNGVSNLNLQVTAVQMYNRALTDSEVVNNFNALRGRYGA